MLTQYFLDKPSLMFLLFVVATHKHLVLLEKYGFFRLLQVVLRFTSY